jgi:hypothetical protein
MKRSIPTRLFVVAFVMLALSCTDVGIKNTTPDVQGVALPEFAAPEGITFNGDYLVIPTPQLYDETMKRIKASDPEGVSTWTAKLGLTSMHDIYERALKEQDDYMLRLEAEYRALSQAELELKTPPVVPQTPTVAEYAALFDFNEYGGITRLKLSNPLMDRLVNKNGLIKVAGHIFQYNENNTKVIIGGDPTKIAFLPTVDATNEKLGIVVNPVTVEHKTVNDDRGRTSYSYSTSFEIGQVGGGYTYYLAYEVSLSSSTWAIYDYQNPVCNPPGCGIPDPGGRTSKTQDCECYYPVIGWTGHVTHYATQHNTKKWAGIETQHQSTTNTILGSVDDTYSGHQTFNVSNQGYVNLTVYIYDGTFYEGFSTTAAAYTFYSDPDGDGPLAGYDLYSWSD